MTEELNTNPTATTADAPITPIATPVETPVTPPIIEPVPEPIAPAEPAPAPVSPTPAPAPTPAPETNNAIQRLLIKAKEKIQFRKRAKLDKVVAKAKEQGSITNDQVEKLLHVSDATASRYLSELVRTGRLRRVSAKGRGARYAPAQ